MAQFNGGQITRMLLEVDAARRNIDVGGSTSYASTLSMFRRGWEGLPLSEELIRDADHLIRIANDQSRSLEVIKELADQLMRRFLSEYGRCGFYAVPATPVDSAVPTTTLVDIYTDPRAWFGAPTFNKLPAARVDAAEACRCYALGRWTACVFHCVRTVEFGIRALATHLNVTLRHPLELADWATLFSSINAEIKDQQGKSRSQAKTDELSDLSTLAKELNYCQYIWRDDVCHARTIYDGAQALDALRHVKNVMAEVTAKIV